MDNKINSLKHRIIDAKALIAQAETLEIATKQLLETDGFFYTSTKEAFKKIKQDLQHLIGHTTKEIGEVIVGDIK